MKVLKLNRAPVKILGIILLSAIFVLSLPVKPEANYRAGHGAGSSPAYGPADQVSWRIRFLEAAIVQGDLVRLGEVAVPAGDIPSTEWAKMSERFLWPAPPDNGRAVNMSRPRLQEAVVATMPDLAPYCLFPGSMALQRGGSVLQKDEVQKLVVKYLTPIKGGMPGESTLSDFRIPQQIFLQYPGQEVVVEPQRKIEPGRINFRFIVKEVDGRTVQRISGSAFMDVWADVPSATVPLNKDDLLEASHVGYTKVNLAHLREEPWDGKGGPWRVSRPIGVEQVIYQSDLSYIPTIRKGSMVTLVYQSRTVRLNVQAEAMTDGVVRETIAVRNLQSKKEVYAVVQDGTTVLIDGSFK